MDFTSSAWFAKPLKQFAFSQKCTDFTFNIKKYSMVSEFIFDKRYFGLSFCLAHILSSVCSVQLFCWIFISTTSFYV